MRVRVRVRVRVGIVKFVGIVPLSGEECVGIVPCSKQRKCGHRAPLHSPALCTAVCVCEGGGVYLVF